MLAAIRSAGSSRLVAALAVLCWSTTAAAQQPSETDLQAEIERQQRLLERIQRGEIELKSERAQTIVGPHDEGLRAGFQTIVMFIVGSIP